MRRVLREELESYNMTTLAMRNNFNDLFNDSARRYKTFASRYMPNLYPIKGQTELEECLLFNVNDNRITTSCENHPNARSNPIPSTRGATFAMQLLESRSNCWPLLNLICLILALLVHMNSFQSQAASLLLAVMGSFKVKHADCYEPWFHQATSTQSFSR